jgi:hypothetical protein
MVHTQDVIEQRNLGQGVLPCGKCVCVLGEPTWGKILNTTSCRAPAGLQIKLKMPQGKAPFCFLAACKATATQHGCWLQNGILSKLEKAET